MGTEMRAIPRTPRNVNDRKVIDTTTPLETVGEVPLETIPEPPAARPATAPQKPPRSITLDTMITYRDYEIRITATGFTLDEFCDLIDKRLGVVS